MAQDPIVKEFVVTASPGTSCQELAELMDRQKVGSVIIVEDERPVGIVTDRDLTLTVVQEARSASETPARAIMNEDIVTIERGAGVLEVIQRMVDGGFRRLPMTQEGRLVDIITLDDLMRLLSQELNQLAKVIERESPYRDIRRYF